MTSNTGRIRDRVLYLAPVGAVAIVGLLWIMTHADSERGQIHTLFQLLALAEIVVALLLRRRKPAGALASILVVYLLVDLQPITLLPVLVALLTVVRVGSRRTVALGAAATTAVVVTMPYLHGDHPSVAAGLLHASAVGCTVVVGRYLRLMNARKSPSGAGLTATLEPRPLFGESRGDLHESSHGRLVVAGPPDDRDG